MENGIYLLGDTPKRAFPLATEGEQGDKKLLAEALEENLTDEERSELVNKLTDK